MSAVATRSLGADSTPAAVRAAARSGMFAGPTGGLSAAYAQANLVVLPRDLAYDFLLFCQRNPKPCPLLDVTNQGSSEPRLIAPGADLRTDLPRYRVFREGELVEERADIGDLWTDDLIGFLLGCSFTFEGPLVEAGVPVRHLDRGRNVPMYRTNRPCVPAGGFAGPLVVTMRPMPADQITRAVQVTSRFPAVHGGPVYIGDPADLGINDLMVPEWGDPPIMEPGDMPVFWACGVTPQAIAMAAKPPLMITHAPGHMFVTDVPVASLAVF
ncbi:MAG: putative hydro-lyase [Thermomicrobiales bacterium]